MSFILPMHGVGGAQDLPIPASYAVVGAGAALAASFVVLMVAWRRPRFDGLGSGSPIPRWLALAIDAGWSRVAARAFGLFLLGYGAWITIWGPDLLINPIFGMVYVLLWVGLVPASLLLGPVWKAISPARTIHDVICRLARIPADDGVLSLPGWVGYWPATLGLFAFVWLELVYERAGYLDSIRLWFLLYLIVAILGALVFGARWFARADPFEVYSTLIAHLSPIGRRSDRQLVWQSPLNHLDGFNPSPSRVGVVAVLLGSTAYDSFGRSSYWVKLSQSADVSSTLLGTLALLGFCVFVGVSFACGTMVTAVPQGMTRRQLPSIFAHSVVPIIVGYVVAHYLSLLLEYGQQVVIYMSDPMASGSNLFGTSDLQVSYLLTQHPTALATLKVLAVLGGHVLGVVAAHDRAVKVLPERHQIVGQLGLLVVMITYTVGGLFLLFSG